MVPANPQDDPIPATAATFRLRRSLRNQAVGFGLVFLAFHALAIHAALTDPEIRHRPAAIAVVTGGPLLMEGLTFWILLAYRRTELTIRGNLVSFRGVLRSGQIDLRGVTSARWRRGTLALRGESARLSLRFEEYQPEDYGEIVRYLRSAIRPEVQDGWNLFAHDNPMLKPPALRLKPGPDEILLTRARWDRLFLALLVAMSVAGLGLWWLTRQTRSLFGPPVPVLIIWALMRSVTPAEGMVDRKVSAFASPDAARFLGFLLLWTLAAGMGLWGYEAYRPRLKHPQAALVAGAVLWFAGLLCGAGLQDRRQSRRRREAADLAAKARGEAVTHVGGLE